MCRGYPRISALYTNVEHGTLVSSQNSDVARLTVLALVNMDDDSISVNSNILDADVPEFKRPEACCLSEGNYALARKPRASMNALAVRRLGGIWEKTRLQLCAQKDGYREFTRILMLNREYPPEEVTSALETAFDMGKAMENVVRQLILNARHEPARPVAVPAALSALTFRAPDLSVYDLLAARGDDR